MGAVLVVILLRGAQHKGDLLPIGADARVAHELEREQVVGLDCLAGATELEMEHLHDELAVPGGPLNTVDKTQTIHRIRNLAEWNERAVSMHVYSRPIDSCVVFDVEAQRCFRRNLKYDNE